VGIETNRAASDTDLPLLPIYQDPLDNICDLDHEGIHGPDGDNHDADDEDGGDVDGPRVEAHVDLSKTPCKYCMTRCHGEN
jgi:hypothetical protein